MKYSFFRGEKIARLGFGTLRLPEGEEGGLQEKDVIQMVDRAIEGGINYFDTAYSYGRGEAEKILGKALARHSRGTYYLADKMPTWKCRSVSDVLKIFQEQLDKCGAEWFDFYLIHSVKDHRYQDIERLHLMEFMKEERRKGRIQYLGASCHCSPGTLRKLLDVYGEDLDFIQLQLNYMDWVAFQGKQLYEIAKEFEKPIIVMEPLRGGMLAYPVSRKAREKLDAVGTKPSYVSMAMRFVDELEQVLVTLSGVSDINQLKENLQILEQGKLTQEEKKAIFAAAEQMEKEILVPCTSCEYCAGCPKKIPISAIFRLYNEAAAMGFHCPWTSLSAQYRKLEKNGTDCIACGKCQRHCPQDIPIIEELRRIDRKYIELEKAGE